MAKIQLDRHYVDPKLVEMYDLENPLGEDSEFYLSFADKIDAKIILDLGCGTGLLTRKLATGDRQLFGIDPAGAMLAYARQQPNAGKVTWIEGTAGDIGPKKADLLIMTGNVAQIFLDEPSWMETLRGIYTALKPGRYVAFESRNPDAKAWEEWTRENSFYTLDSPSGPVECWVEVVSAADGLVHFQGFNRFLNSGEEIIVDSTLRFRTQGEIESSLIKASFTVENVYGDWHGGPVTKQSRPMVFIAKKSTSIQQGA